MKNPLTDEITSLADNRLDENRKKKLEYLIKNNRDMEFDLEAEMTIKNLLGRKSIQAKAPAHLRAEIISKIKPAKKRSKFAEFRDFLSSLIEPKPVFAAAFAILILLLFSFSRDSFSPEEMIRKQSGENNLVSKALNNFSGFRDGRIKVETSTDNPELIREYFKKNNLGFTAEIPQCKCWKLEGAFVSTIGNMKLANNIYRSENGNIICLSQAGKELVSRYGCLTSDFLECLESEECVKIEDGNCCMAVFHFKGNIYTMISSDKLSEVEKTFMKNFIS